MREEATTSGGADGDAMTQQGRRISIDTPLGPDKLLLTRLAGEEAISELFSYDIDMLSEDHAIAPESLIGHRVQARIACDDGDDRVIDALVVRFRVGPVIGRRYRLYSAELAPWLWMLTHTTDCRIFQNLSPPDIIEQVFQTFGFTDYQFQVARADYPKLEFCVQYRESAFHFVARLMEQFGMFWFFRHDERHKLIIADDNAAFRDLDNPELIYAPANPLFGQLTEWQHSYEFRPGGWAQNDFNFETPSGSLRTSRKTLLKLRGAEAIERFDHPGLYQDNALGTRLTRLRIEADEAAHHLARGASGTPRLEVGGKFRVMLHSGEDEGRTYVVRRLRHEASETSYLGTTGTPSSYRNSFQAIRHDIPFRPLWTTEKPVVAGPQTAMVVGPPGEKIYTDKYARVRVQFHWDRYGQRDDRSSCWIRVSQNWAGRGWGGVNLPHVGHEVVVSFLEGDPDRPLVTGRVYNGENADSIGLPANKTQSGLRDHSGNQIVMEGKSGVEDFRAHATKDMNVTVTNDYNEAIQNGNRSIQVAAGTHTETIKGDTKVTVTTGALTMLVAANTATFQSKSTTTITSTTADIHGQASTQIALDVGDSHLVMTKDGTILLNCKNLVLFGSESVTIRGNAIRSIADQEHETKGAITVSEGQTTNTVKGGMVMLNPGT